MMQSGVMPRKHRVFATGASGKGVIYGSATLKHLNQSNFALSKVMPKKVSKSLIADRYAKIVEWSDEDSCYIGRVPALSYGGVHGSDRAAVFSEICQVAEEVVELMLADGRKLPNPEQKKYSGKFVLRVDPGLHEALALKAEERGSSLNAVASAALRSGLAVVT